VRLTWRDDTQKERTWRDDKDQPCEEGTLHLPRISAGGDSE